MAKPADSISPFESFDYDWGEELGDDNGELITLEPGEPHYGRFVQRVTIDLPEDKRENGQETADMLVFSMLDDESKRWSCWVTYQLDKAFAHINPGDQVRIECTGTRKANQGNVKIISVKRRVS